jgi:hypothetical protein
MQYAYMTSVGQLIYTAIQDAQSTWSIRCWDTNSNATTWANSYSDYSPTGMVVDEASGQID